MDDQLALKKLHNILELVDEYGRVYDERWQGENKGVSAQLDVVADEVEKAMQFASAIASAMNETTIATAIAKRYEGAHGGHPWQAARTAIVQLIAIIEQQEELEAMLGPTGPQLDAAALHPHIWAASARLWDDNHPRQAVQAAASALELKLQTHAGPAVAGEKLASLFSLKNAKVGEPRLRIRDLEEDTPTWRSVHEGAAALTRGAMMAVRNLVSHPTWPEPTGDEALEMIAVLSYVAHLVDRSAIEEA